MTQRRSKTRLTKAERRATLLEHARKLFAQQGYAATTAAQVAECAGVSAAVAAKVFADGPALVRGIAGEMHAEMFAEPEPGSAAPESQGRLHTIFKRFPRAAAKPDSPARVTLKLLAEGDAEALAAVSDGLEPSVLALAELVRGGQQEGVFRRSLEPSRAAWELLRSLLALALLGGVEPAPPADAELPAPGIDCLLHGLLKTDV